MKALVFGGAGQLGQALQATDHNSWAIKAIGRAECDITNEAETRAIIASNDCDVVINAAAYTAVDKAESELELAQIVNGYAPGWMACECAKANKAFVQISTDFVFGVGYNTAISVNAKPSPLSVYGATKLIGEIAVKAAKPDALILRTSWVYAAKGSNFVLTMLRLMKERGQLSVVADQVGSPTAAQDLADAIIELVDAKAAGMYHFTNNGECSWHEFAVVICEEAIKAGLLEKAPVINAIPTSAYPTPATRPNYSVLEKQKTWDVLGGSARHWREALKETIMEIKKYG
jgi:dTDP-4-dehydrorhamnose reductase